MTTTLMTERLVLRQWRDEDREPFAASNADPAVMRHFPAVLTRAESDALVDRLAAGIAERGWGIWAAETRAGGAFAGFVGLQPLGAELPFAPGVEIGWRLGSVHQGLGYATEGARQVLDFAFGELRLPEVVSFTTTLNQPSRHVMEKLGMSRDPADDFDHPRVPADWPGRRHVLYRLAAPHARG
ncbi:GNAT family N-acetyltransferase [Micromonosporaceae bacterium Da 78-11]